MQKINFQNLPSTATPINATNLNAIQTNVEDVFNGSEPMGNVIVDSIRSKNMFNPYIQSWTYGGLIYSVASDGKITQNASDGIQWQDSEGKSFILPAGTYTFSVIGKNSDNTFQVYNYNTSSSIYESTVSTFTYTFNEATRLGIKTYGSVYPDNYYIQMETGSTATDYAPYQELNNQENYTTSEKKIGTWINGKPLYRQTFGFSNVPTGQETNLYWNNSIYGNSVSNIEDIVNYKAFFHRYNQDDTPNNFQQVPTVHSNMTEWGSGIYDLYQAGCLFWAGTMLNYYKIHTLVITIEYTKTTD